MSCMIPATCVFCQHYHEERNEHSDELPSCDAFDAIPDQIFMGEVDHTEPLQATTGCSFSSEKSIGKISRSSTKCARRWDCGFTARRNDDLRCGGLLSAWFWPVAVGLPCRRSGRPGGPLAARDPKRTSPCGLRRSAITLKAPALGRKQPWPLGHN